MTDTAAATTPAYARPGYISPRHPQAHLSYPHLYRTVPDCPGCHAPIPATVAPAVVVAAPAVSPLRAALRRLIGR